ncbi:MAG TPA: hypothetical protein DCZ95_10695 [Verrucomicrobia bacterium]|nr:MAG: hypothetical protein A2X46_18450 [Lentisphaerae bacterium GWF2_57_35]HBA84551.1 hypothetical protein [Verrucomicrobiota bacterium]
MPNILLTNYCNRSCPYCFAKEQVALGTSTPRWEMSLAEYETILGYLRPGRDSVALLGGEPTLHRHFAQLVKLALDRRYSVKIFTNGTNPRLREVVDLSPSSALRIIVNLNPPDQYTKTEWTEIVANGRAFGDRARLSFNIYTPGFEWDYLRRTIQETGLGKSIRIGITQPIQGEKNVYLKDADLRSVAARLVEMAVDLAKDGIVIGFDCGFQRCLFTPDELATLVECGAELLFVCKPILDIGPDLKVWRCFPFSGAHSVTLTQFSSLEEISRHFLERWQEPQARGSLKSCVQCRPFADGVCSGGCMSRTLARAGGDS